MGSGPSSSYAVGVTEASTVEPDEPVETGIRTTWYRWTAPTNDRYTWRLNDTRNTELQLSMFTGDTLAALKLVGHTGPGVTSTEFVANATAQDVYSFALGYSAEDSQSLSPWSGSADATLTWGPTPENDALAHATRIAATNGSISGSNEFATTERGERGGQLGHSSLWWTFDPPTSGWYRFSVAGNGLALAVYTNPNGPIGSLELVGSSLSAEPTSTTETTEVLFQAKAGTRYAIRLGTLGDTVGSEFTLSWEVGAPPSTLRYVGNVSTEDAVGNTVEIQDASLVLDADGAHLHAFSGLGLQTFERDAETGLLTLHSSRLGVDFAGAALLWDHTRSRLYAKTCDIWRSFTWDSAIDGFEAHGVVFTVPGDNECADDLLIDSTGSVIYSIGPDRRMDILNVSATDEFEYVGQAEDGFCGSHPQAVISDDGRHVFALCSTWAVVTFERTIADGRLVGATLVEDELNWGYLGALATVDPNHLFVVHYNNPRVSAFDIEQDASNPEFVSAVFPPELTGPSGFYGSECNFASARLASPTLYVFCDGWAYSVRLTEGELTVTDRVIPRVATIYERSFGSVKSAASSPDGKHVYLSTQDQGIVIFERPGHEATATPPAAKRASRRPQAIR